MSNLAFFNYRTAAFNHYVMTQLSQLKQLGVILTLFMYTAVPGLILLIFLALGKVLTQDEQLGLTVALALIVGQLEISAALGEGVRDHAHRPFQRTLVSKAHRRFSDVVLGFASNPVLLFSVPLLLSLKLSQFTEAAPFIVFVTVVALSGLLATYFKDKAKLYICLLLVSNLLYQGDLLSSMLLSLCLLVLVFLLPQKWLSIGQLGKHFGFWLRFHIHTLDQLWWRLLAIFGLIVCAQILFVERPDLAFFIHCFISPFALYIACSQQLNQNDLLIQYAPWLHSLNNAKSLIRGQFTAPACLVFIALFGLQWISIDIISLVLFSASAFATIWFTCKKPSQFALGWFVINGVVLSVNYALYITVTN